MSVYWKPAWSQCRQLLSSQLSCVQQVRMWTEGINLISYIFVYLQLVPEIFVWRTYYSILTPPVSSQGYLVSLHLVLVRLPMLNSPQPTQSPSSPRLWVWPSVSRMEWRDPSHLVDLLTVSSVGSLCSPSWLLPGCWWSEDSVLVWLWSVIFSWNVDRYITF